MTVHPSSRNCRGSVNRYFLGTNFLSPPKVNFFGLFHNLIETMQSDELQLYQCTNILTAKDGPMTPQKKQQITN